MVTAFTYGGPRVGDDGLNKEFKRLIDHHHLRLLRITNANDPVHKLPLERQGYTHLGKELKIDTSNSPYLKWRWFGTSPYVSSVNPEFDPNSDGITTEEETAIAGGVGEYFSAHNMDVYLHGIAGVQEEGCGFCLEVDHDIALVNKRLDRLKDVYGIPTNWWKGENRKKMVQRDDGHWEVITP
ncbi:hypothetical protein like AT2G31100 [Hibiscus trionum]|uniref:Phospholipase A1 n=1 Tax=Hibiscus trionum TaxID=183268 RepID=A0A9W7M4M2_HIBTR|nr:hypothetical protein like AT2G31100 [Hibiscus trionum]